MKLYCEVSERTTGDVNMAVNAQKAKHDRFLMILPNQLKITSLDYGNSPTKIARICRYDSKPMSHFLKNMKIYRGTGKITTCDWLII